MPRRANLVVGRKRPCGRVRRGEHRVRAGAGPIGCQRSAAPRHPPFGIRRAPPERSAAAAPRRERARRARGPRASPRGAAPGRRRTTAAEAPAPRTTSASRAGAGAARPARRAATGRRACSGTRRVATDAVVGPSITISGRRRVITLKARRRCQRSGASPRGRDGRTRGPRPRRRRSPGEHERRRTPSRARRADMASGRAHVDGRRGAEAPRRATPRRRGASSARS